MISISLPPPRRRSIPFLLMGVVWTVLFLSLLFAPPADCRRWLVGSSPPTCRGRCGWCAPCRPVRVVIHPGTSVPLEYYPEAWRCQCGNKLFMP